MFVLKVYCSAVPKPDADFAKDLVKQQTDQVPESFFSVSDCISKSAVSLRNVFSNCF